MKVLLCSFFLSLSCMVHAQEIGLQLYSLRNEMPKDVPGTLALIKNWGVSYLEGGGTYGLPMKEFNALLEKNGLKIVSIGADFKDLETDPASVAAKAKAFGAKFIMCAWIPHEGNSFTIDDARKAVLIFNAAGKLLAEQGLSLCYHPHGYEFGTYAKGTVFDFMAEAINPLYANFEMDVYWVRQAGQNPVQLLNKYPNRFKMLHLKDRRPGTPDSQDGHADVETNVVLGEGDVGMAEIMKTAQKIGVQYYFIEDESSRVVDQIPKSLAYLKSLKK